MTLSRIAEGVHAFDYEVSMGLTRFPCRTTVVDTGEGLLLVSPGKMDEEIERAIATLGDVRFILAPNQFHHVHALPAAERFSEATLLAAPGLAAKLDDERFATTPGGERAFGPDIDWLHIEGVPKSDELVLFHRPSKTLITTDLIMNVTDGPFMTRMLLRMFRGYGRPRTSRLWRSLAKDRGAVAASLESIRDWDFERIVVNHGEVVEADAKAAYDDATGWLRAWGGSERVEASA
jgi:hypothetical protein